MIGDSLWTFLVVGGFVVLAAATAFAMRHNHVSPRQEQRTEDATRKLYDEGTVDRDHG